MSQPPPYLRQYNFTTYQASFPNDPLPGNEVDGELNEVKQTLDAILANLVLIQRDDGALKNLSVGLDQLKPEVVLGTPTDWVTATAYEAKDVVWQGGVLYVCNTAHTSGTFATDLAATKWTAYLDYSDPLGDAAGFVSQAEDAATAAEDAQAAAEDAQAAAEAAQALAETAQAAAEAAIDAIAIPWTVAQGGTGATTAAGARTNIGAGTLGANVFMSANVAAVITALDLAASKATYQQALDVEVGVDVQPYDADTAKLDVAQNWTAAQTFQANPTVSNADPALRIYETDGGVNEKDWRLCAAAGVLSLGAYTDAGALGANVFTVTRSAATPALLTTTVPVQLPAGSASSPSVQIGEAQTGLFRQSPAAMAVSMAGTLSWLWSTSQLSAQNSGVFLAGNGGVGAPGFAFKNATGLGWYMVSATEFAGAVGGAKKVQIDTDGVKDGSGNILQSGGKRAVPVLASAFSAQDTNGPGWYRAELATNKQLVQGWAFDASTAEYIQFTFPAPKSWNEGTFTVRFRWYSPSGTGNVVWAAQALAISDDDAIDASWGTAQTVTDAVTATTDLMVSAETSAITAAGTPAEGDLVILRVYRNAADGSDTLASDAILLGVDFFPSFNGANDA